MKPVFLLDAYLLFRVAQPTVNWFGRRWGVHFVKVGATLFWASVSCVVGQGLLVVLTTVENIALGGMIVAAWGLLVLFWCSLFHDAVIEARRTRSGHLNANILRAFGARFASLLNVPLQAALLAMPPWRWWEVILLAGYLFVGAAFYVLSCNEAPPKQKRVPFWHRLRISVPRLIPVEALSHVF